MGGRHHAFAAAPLDFLRGTDIKPDPDIMYAINRTATIALPMSNQLNRNVFEQWYETATSLTKIRNVLITQMQPCRSRGRRAPQPPSAKFPLRSEGGGFKLRLKQPNNPVPSSVRQVIGRTLRQLRALIGQATADDLRASYRWTLLASPRGPKPLAF